MAHDDRMSEYFREMAEKPILDACCGGRYFHFDKNNPLVLYMDNRIAPKGHSKWRKNHEVKPDIVADFRKMPFRDKSFKLIVFDPPHLTNAGPNGDMGKRYGRLSKATWKDDIGNGFKECWRVLDDYGVLVLKWSEVCISLKDLSPLFPSSPIFGHRTGKEHKTIWCTFFKQPSEKCGCRCHKDSGAMDHLANHCYCNPPPKNRVKNE